MALQDAVELNGLARGDTDRAVGETFAQGVQRQILVRRQPPARHARARHDGVFLVQPLLLARRGGVPVVLLINTVEFQEIVVVLGKPVRGLVRQGLRDRAAQLPAGQLDGLDTRRCRDRRRRRGWSRLSRRYSPPLNGVLVPNRVRRGERSSMTIHTTFLQYENV